MLEKEGFLVTFHFVKKVKNRFLTSISFPENTFIITCKTFRRLISYLNKRGLHCLCFKHIFEPHFTYLEQVLEISVLITRLYIQLKKAKPSISTIAQELSGIHEGKCKSQCLH